MSHHVSPSPALVSRFTDALWDSVQHILTHETDVPVRRVIEFHLGAFASAVINEHENKSKGSKPDTTDAR